MAKKAATAVSGVQVAPDFGFFRKLKTGDKYLDHNKKRPEYGFIPSGSYAFNSALSGDVYQGFNMNKFFMAVGFYGTGKSLIAKLNFALELMKKGYYIFWYDTENETTEESLINDFGFIEGQFEIVRMHTVEQLHHSLSTLVTQLEEDKGEGFENNALVDIMKYLNPLYVMSGGGAVSQPNLATNKTYVYVADDAFIATIINNLVYAGLLYMGGTFIFAKRDVK